MATGTFCPRDPEKGHVDIAFGIKRRIGYRMQVLRDRHCDFDLVRIAGWPLVETTTGPDEAPNGTRATTKSSELMTTAPSISPKRTRGRRNSGGRKLLPMMRTSPPGKARLGAPPRCAGGH